MNVKSQFNETVIANSLVAIFERLIEIEKSINILAATTSSIAQPHAELMTRLDRLTLKRHAVLTATLGGLSYKRIALLMDCDITTIKLSLKATLEVLQVRTRAILLVSSPGLLNFITDAEYERRFGLSKRWWLEDKPELMAVLMAKKPPNNQHVRSPTEPKA